MTDEQKEIRISMSDIDGSAGELIYLLEQADEPVYQDLLDKLNDLQNEVTNIQEELGYI